MGVITAVHLKVILCICIVIVSYIIQYIVLQYILLLMLFYAVLFIYSLNIINNSIYFIYFIEVSPKSLAGTEVV